MPAFVLCPSSLVLGSCATPVAPTGGPVDQTPPRLVASSPEADAVGVSARTVRLTFSERIDAASALRAVTVTPEAGPGEPVPQVSAAADELVVELPALRDSTTYVVTVGAELADRRGVRLQAPVTLAFSTGPELDRGVLAGTVRQPDDGAGASGLAVLAYRVTGDGLPDPRTDRPDARTETGADGTFRLGYLADVPHFVAALRDLNRNGRADDGEPFAAPPRPRLQPTLDAPPDTVLDLSFRPDSVAFPAPRPGAPASAAPVEMWLARRDTVPPQARSVRALSNRRFRVRYSEGVELEAELPWSFQATLGATVQDASGAALGAGRLYAVPEDAAELELWTDAPVRPGPARILALARDSVGLTATAPSPVFEVPERADTLVTRFVRFEPAPPAPDSAATLVPQSSISTSSSSAPPRVVLSGPSDRPARIVSALDNGRVAVADSFEVSGFVVTPWIEFMSGDRTAHAVPNRVTVSDAGTTTVGRFEMLDADALGSGSLRVPRASGGAELVVELVGPGGVVRRPHVGTNGNVHLDRLLPGTYRVRAWLDQDASGTRQRWDGGSLAPYAPPEPLVILAEPVEVRARWETEIDAALFDPLFDAPRAAPDR